MSKEDFKKVKRRLEKAKQEIAWVLAVLRDQDDALKSYNLSDAEKEQIAQESLEAMTALLLPLAQQLAKHPQAPIQSVTLEQMENLHFSQYGFGNVVSSEDIVSVEVVGPGGPPRRAPSTDISIHFGEGNVIISHEETTAAGDQSITINRSNVVSEGGGTRQGDHENEDI